MKTELLVDMRSEALKASLPEMKRSFILCSKINTTLPYTDEYYALLQELFENRLDKSNIIVAPIHIDLANGLTLGKNIYINHSFECMARGKVFIGDGVMIGPSVSILSANHDLLDHQILRCASVHIEKNVWIGAKAIILPGVTIGENAVIGAGSVVTKDVESYTVVAGNPAKVIKKIGETNGK